MTQFEFETNDMQAKNRDKINKFFFVINKNSMKIIVGILVAICVSSVIPVNSTDR